VKNENHEKSLKLKKSFTLVFVIAVGFFIVGGVPRNLKT